ncbi:MAG: histidinol-phosphate transaminase [Actinomycetes bacterium]
MTTPARRDDLVGVMPYGAPQLDVPIRLNVNENPFAPSADLINAIREVAGRTAQHLNRYPDREARDLRVDLASYIRAESHGDVSWENVWVANGSNEVMHHLLQAFGGPGRLVVTFAPTYSMYEEYCRETFTNYASVPRTSDFDIDRTSIDAALALKPDIVIICSPNNPTGTVLQPDLLEYLVTSFQGLIIVDEAYGEFRASGTDSAIKRYAGTPHVVITRTMSKAFSCAGLRVGYAIAHPDVVEACRVVRLPYHISAMTQEIARAAIGFSDELLGHVAVIRDEREALAAWLAQHGFTVAPSGANFLLFGSFADRHAIWQGLLDRGVLIRETGPEGMLRVSIGTPLENQAFRDALLRTTQ